MLKDPCKLYLSATDEVRARLNQAIFDRMFISDEEVVAVRMNESHGHLLAAEAAYRAAKAGPDTDAVQVAFTNAFAENTATKQKTAPEGDLLNSTVATTAWVLLFTPASTAGVSIKNLVVEILRTHSKQQRPEKSAMSAFEEAVRCRNEA